MKTVEIQLIRNATLKINYAGKTFLVDPVLGAKNSMMSFVQPDKNLNPTVDLPLSTDKVIEGVDTILVTHTHPDHFDETAMEVLDKKLPVYAQPFDAKNIKKAGFEDVTVVESSAKTGEITINRTTGKHGPEDTLEMLGEVSGFLLQRADYPAIYIVGDCVWDADVENTLKKYSPDIVITNSGGASFMGKNRILMDEKETIKVANTVPNAKVIAVHTEALDHCATTRAMLKEEAEKEGIAVLVPEDGETISL